MTHVALVTGGTRGIGRAIAEGLKAAGHTVIANYHSKDKIAQAFTSETGIPAVKFNVASAAGVENAVAKIMQDHGEIGILVNNAGITRDGFLHKSDPTDWEAVLATNLTSAYHLSRAVMTSMRGNGFGRVINISSINGQKGQLGQTNYSAAKAGLIGFTKALALEGARKGITVNAICPGYIKTDMTASMHADVLANITAQIPVGRLGRPEEIAAAAVWLASDLAAFVTGAVIPVNGGQFMGG